MAEFNSFLWVLFKELREQGLSLGISEYLLAIKSIREGAGVEDVGRLQRFCRLLWAKSEEDQIKFDKTFNEWVKPRLEVSLPTKTSNFERNRFTSSSNHFSSTSYPTTQKGSATKKQQYTKSKVLQYQPQTAISTPSLSQESFEEVESIQPQIKYDLTPRLPINRREMASIWRYLRRLRREGVPEDLDVEGTISDICQTGFFLRPVLQPRRQNQVKLVILIDREGSMAPFTPLIDALQESIEKGGLLGKTSVYYFHDCPEGFVFEQPSLSVPLPLEEFLPFQAKGNSVLIVSDAGAARGFYDRQRLAETKKFLKDLSDYTYLYAWLNPVPDTRWLTTTAEDIARLVPMFSLNREGLNDTVKILLGHPFPPGVGLGE